MEMFMMASGSMKCAPELVLTIALMDQYTKDSGMKTISMVQLRRHTLMEVNMKDNLIGDKSMVLDSLHMLIKLSTKVNGYRIRLPELVFIIFQMVASMKENS